MNFELSGNLVKLGTFSIETKMSLRKYYLNTSSQNDLSNR